jgi:tetratricopeptide (TPR) repeat protein
MMTPTEQPPASEPQTVEEFLRVGWNLHASGQFEAAEKDFRKALALKPDSIDSYYALGLSLKAQDRREETIQAFQTVVSLLDKEEGASDSRRTMLHRLALGHINMLKLGDWNLEKEIWQKR